MASLLGSAIGGVLILTIAVNYQQGNRLFYFGFSSGDWGNSPAVRTSLLFVIMLFGVMAGHLFRILPKTKEITFRRILATLRRGDFIKAVLGSPLVFGVVYAAAREQPDLVLASVLAFQNGFVCHTVLATLTGEGQAGKLSGQGDQEK